ncbi:DUF125-domain-containing protein [Saccharata proteae CBS 121410]|uniref:DUF125-domain-containing protein n=1 Tax=Saccharata proteae CBS 121410 TaxID=1314787 RepID=A0A9P4LVM6_9PEZI|nr:DUF125-domain-containing protein [Saccharata proteae CBS 121410]
MLDASDLEKQTPSEEPTSSEEPGVETRRWQIDARVLSDLIIGLSDGLTVPFALTAGLSALGSTKVVIYGGMAELIAGAISMGLGGYLGAKSEEESYLATLSQTTALTTHSPQTTHATIRTLLSAYALPPHLSDPLTTHLSQPPHATAFLMRFQHSLPPTPPPSRAFICALTIALGYFCGGFVPLLPYFFVDKEAVRQGLCWSVGVMVAALFLFGAGKTVLVAGFEGWRGRWRCVKAGLQMVVVGSAAAGAAMALVVLFRRIEGAS